MTRSTPVSWCCEAKGVSAAVCRYTRLRWPSIGAVKRTLQLCISARRYVSSRPRMSAVCWRSKKRTRWRLIPRPEIDIEAAEPLLLGAVLLAEPQLRVQAVRGVDLKIGLGIAWSKEDHQKAKLATPAGAASTPDALRARADRSASPAVGRRLTSGTPGSAAWRRQTGSHQSTATQGAAAKPRPARHHETEPPAPG